MNPGSCRMGAWLLTDTCTVYLPARLAREGLGSSTEDLSSVAPRGLRSKAAILRPGAASVGLHCGVLRAGPLWSARYPPPPRAQQAHGGGGVEVPGQRGGGAWEQEHQQQGPAAGTLPPAGVGGGACPQQGTGLGAPECSLKLVTRQSAPGCSSTPLHAAEGDPPAHGGCRGWAGPARSWGGLPPLPQTTAPTPKGSWPQVPPLPLPQPDLFCKIRCGGQHCGPGLQHQHPI